MVRLITRIIVQPLLVILLGMEDTVRVSPSVGSSVCVSDMDGKDSSGTTSPEAVETYVPSQVVWRGSVSLSLSLV